MNTNRIRIILGVVLVAIFLLALDLGFPRRLPSMPAQRHTTWTALLNDSTQSGALPPFLKKRLSIYLRAGFFGSPKPGHYRFSTRISLFAWIRALEQGRQTPVRLVLNKQRTPHRLAAFLGQKLMADSAAWMAVLKDSVDLDSGRWEAQNNLLLFLPDTYEVYWTVAPTVFVERMRSEYRRFWNPERINRAQAQGLSPREALILASIIEEETQYEAERPRIAGVYLNRLRIGMPLQADPTIKFALGRFDLRRIGLDHTLVASPYNTYRRTGLPPGPVCIPSKNAIKSVLDPENHSFLYFCADPLRAGTHRFATTFAEHTRNARLYRKSLDRRGVKIQS
ncbi:MAG: endolytic transglycosylase MltG [Bacteroidia bacterium]